MTIFLVSAAPFKFRTQTILTLLNELTLFAILSLMLVLEWKADTFSD